MKHFELSEWTDFVRGTAAGAAKTAMQGHLGAGCKKCGRAVEMLRRFAAAAVSSTRYEAPGYAVHCAEAIFALQKPEKVHILPRLMAKLVFDSFREPLPVGVRTQQHLSRQALYEAGDFRLDLRLEHERGSSQVSLVGQIENRKNPSHRVGNVPVLLTAGKDVVARTLSNQFGEFHFSYQPRTHLRLYVPVVQDNGHRIEVPLRELHSESVRNRGPIKRHNARKRGSKQ